MDFKSMLQQLSQLSEGTEETPTGRKHTADPGGYGRKYDTDEEGDEDKKGEKKEPAAKRGRGRPKKGADSDTGKVANYDNAKNLQSFMVGNLPGGKLPGKPGKKHTLKDWVEQVEAKYVAEAAPGQQLTVKPMPGAAQLVDPASNKVMATGDAAAIKNVQGAVAQGKVQMRGDVEESMDEGVHTRLNTYRINGQDLIDQLSIQDGAEVEMVGDDVAILVVDTITFPELASMASKLAQQGKIKAIAGPATKDITGKAVPVGRKYINAPSPRDPKSMAESDEDYSAKKARAGKDIGKPGKQFAKIAKSAAERYGSAEKGKKVAGAVLAKLRKGVNEVEQPTMDNQTAMGAGLGAGRSQTTLEGKKPDFLDLDKDKNKKEPMSDAANDAKKKKKIKESAHRHSSAKLLGKAHALAKEAYNCKYDDLDEVRMYHEGYKEGLDECYGQGVYEMAPATPPATTGGMAQQALEAEMDEGNAFTAALAKTPPGGKFTVGGKSFTDRSGYDAKLDELAFESLDKQLNALLESEQKVDEGMTVSISKGQQGMPDAVTVSAQDGEADALLSLIKQAGLGLFGDDKQDGYGVPDGSDVANSHGDIKVVGDHDGMMSIMKKLAGTGPQGNDDYADEEGHDHGGHDHMHEEDTCNECGYMESKCQCDEEAVMGEEESYAQEEEQVAEDNPPDSGAAETTADENAEAAEDMALAKSGQKSATITTNEGGDGGEASEEPVTEWANDAGAKAKDFDDESFDTDIDFITKVISGGLNKQKSTGQTTIPVVAGQKDRMEAHESINAWKKLAGI